MHLPLPQPQTFLLLPLSGVYVIYNVLSVGVFFPLFVILSSFGNLSILHSDISPFGVALFHTVYNICTAFMLLPFAKVIEKLAIMCIPDKKENRKN